MKKTLKIIVGVVAIAILGLGIFLVKNNSTATTKSNSSDKNNSEIAKTESTSTAPENQTPATTIQSSATPTTCNGTLTKQETEGPYYTAGSPEKNNFTADGTGGTALTITGYVFDTSCKPIAGAIVDIWHANALGQYDNSGYLYRGHSLTDATGKYTFISIIPGKYPSRTEHTHVKVGRTVGNYSLTTQLFPPDGTNQESDSIFDASLLMQNFADSPSGGKTATFNFVIK